MCGRMPLPFAMAYGSEALRRRLRAEDARHARSSLRAQAGLSTSGVFTPHHPSPNVFFFSETLCCVENLALVGLRTESGGLIRKMSVCSPPPPAQAHPLDPPHHLAFLSKNNDRPSDVAVRLGVDVKVLVATNKGRYPGLRHNSRLKANTRLIYPMTEDGGEPPLPLAASDGSLDASAALVVRMSDDGTEARAEGSPQALERAARAAADADAEEQREQPKPEKPTKNDEQEAAKKKKGAQKKPPKAAKKPKKAKAPPKPKRAKTNFMFFAASIREEVKAQVLAAAADKGEPLVGRAVQARFVTTPLPSSLPTPPKCIRTFCYSNCLPRFVRAFTGI